MMVPSILVVVSSSCQLYSGTGRALFDWLTFAAGAFSFSLLIDTGAEINVKVAVKRCSEAGVTLIPSSGVKLPGCPDFLPLSTASTLQSQHWDAVECLSWANAATNSEVLANLAPDTKLVFTPHTQPLWTLRTAKRDFMVEPVLASMLSSSDLVLADTPHEAELLRARGLRTESILQIPLAVDTDRFRQVCVGDLGPRILVVADFLEPRKRPDLLLRALEDILAVRPDVTPVLAGRDSDRLELPPRVASAARCLGYLGEDDLLREFQQASVYLLLSDFEAFGLGIAEALCCGARVVIHRQAETYSVFGDLPGVVTVQNSDILAVRTAILAQLTHGANRSVVAAAAAERFGVTQTLGQKVRRLQRLLQITP